jgi:hypothetical protein
MNREEWDVLRKTWAFEAEGPLGSEESSEESRLGSEESSEETLGRQPSTVRTMYLRLLLERGTLIRKYPDHPRHPHQAYRAAKTDA